MDHSNGLCASGRLDGRDGVEATGDSEILHPQIDCSGYLHGFDGLA